MCVVERRRADYDLADLERRLRIVSRTWSDDLRDALLARFGEEQGTSLFRRYGEAFRAGYREAYAARIAVLDVEKMERIRENGIEMSLYRPLEADEARLRFKLFQLGRRPVALSDVLPMLENMGFKVEDEHPSNSNALARPGYGCMISACCTEKARILIRTVSRGYSGRLSPGSGRVKSRMTASTGSY